MLTFWLTDSASRIWPRGCDCTLSVIGWPLPRGGTAVGAGSGLAGFAGGAAGPVDWPPAGGGPAGGGPPAGGCWADAAPTATTRTARTVRAQRNIRKLQRERKRQRPLSAGGLDGLESPRPPDARQPGRVSAPSPRAPQQSAAARGGTAASRPRAAPAPASA